MPSVRKIAFNSASKIARLVGCELVRAGASNSDNRRRRLMQSLAPDIVLDIGANDGGFGRELRSQGYRGEIVSFEPIKEVFQKLVTHAASDKNWRAYNYALGSTDAEMPFNIAANAFSSSLLPMNGTHLAAAPGSGYVRSELISVKKLDSVYSQLGVRDKRVLMKLDVQGYERSVLSGAENSLSSIGAIRTELSLVPLYDGSDTVIEMLSFLNDLGFTLVDLIPGFCNTENGRLLQVDGVFANLRCYPAL